MSPKRRLDALLLDYLFMKNQKLIIAQNYSNSSNEVLRVDNNVYIFALAISIVAAILFVVYKFYYSKKSKSTVAETPQATTSPTSARQPVHVINLESLESQLRELAFKAWTTEASLTHTPFLLNPNDFPHICEPQKFVELLLCHARNTASGFEIPYMVPHVVVEAIPFAAGLFQVDKEGWVTIKVGSDFFDDKLAAQAILAHEVCHYILENSGIRKSDYLLNERYTDMCMFICGFGQIFQAGYKREMAQNEYRPGHRLGYLTDADFLQSQADKIFEQAENLESLISELEEQ